MEKKENYKNSCSSFHEKKDSSNCNQIRSSGTFFVGSKRAIDLLAEKSTEICRKYHRELSHVHAKMKNLVDTEKKKNSLMKSKNKMHRTDRMQLYKNMGVKEDLAKLEFIHFQSVPINTAPKDVIIDKDAERFIFDQQKSYLEGTAFYSADRVNKEIGTNSMITKVYGKVLKKLSESELSSEVQSGSLYYLLGVEPLSVNSCLSGYKTCANKSHLIGAVDGRHSNYLHCAVKETKEEAHIDVRDLLNSRSYKDMLFDAGLDTGHLCVNSHLYLVIVNEHVKIDVSNSEMIKLTMKKDAKDEELSELNERFNKVHVSEANAGIPSPEPRAKNHQPKEQLAQGHNEADIPYQPLNLDPQSSKPEKENPESDDHIK